MLLRIMSDIYFPTYIYIIKLITLIIFVCETQPSLNLHINFIMMIDVPYESSKLEIIQNYHYKISQSQSKDL
jgi:hypothetical protein